MVAILFSFRFTFIFYYDAKDSSPGCRSENIIIICGCNFLVLLLLLLLLSLIDFNWVAVWF